MSDNNNIDEWKWNNDGVSNNRELLSVSIHVPFVFVVIFVIIVVMCCCCGRQQRDGEGQRAQAGQEIGVSPSKTVRTGKPTAVAVPIGGEHGFASEGRGGGVRGGREGGGVVRQNEESSNEC